MSDNAAARACQENMRHWYLARIEAAAGRIIRQEGVVWGVAGDDLMPPGSGAIMPFPEKTNADGLNTAIQHFVQHRVKGWCTLGAPLSSPDVRAALKRAGFVYRFPAVCMVRLGASPLRKVKQISGIEIRDLRQYILAETATHPSYGSMKQPAAQRTWQTVQTMAQDDPVMTHLLGAFCDNELIGSATLHFDGQAVGIYDLATIPRWRRHGIGALLLSTALESAAALTSGFIVLQNDASLVPLYQSFGFKSVATLEHWIFDPPRSVDNLVQARSVSNTAIEDLATAAILDDQRRVEQLLEAWPDLARCTVSGSEGATPLHMAAYHGASRAVAALLRGGADADTRDIEFLATPLEWAMYGLSESGPVFKRDQTGAAEILRSAGAKFIEEVDPHV